MRRFTLLFSALALTAVAHAQTVSTFDALSLPGSDTCYINYNVPGTDVGFNNGLAHFPCEYDTSSFGDYWGGGFSYSNETDSVTSGYMNSYSAKTASGYSGAEYAVVWCNDPVTYTYYTKVKLLGAAVGKPVSGFYVTNSTYAYNSMRDGLDAPAKKFGGTSGNDPDWFLLTVKGYHAGSLTADSVNFYLADFRFAHNDSDYIVRTWQWINLLPLGHVDSLQFHLSSSDNGSFGMNTPGYFCMDNFTTNETSVGVNNTPVAAVAKIYPNPAADVLYADIADNNVRQITVTDVTGRVIENYAVTQSHIAINTASLPSGTYVLQLAGDGKVATTKFVKK